MLNNIQWIYNIHEAFENNVNNFENTFTSLVTTKLTTG